MRSDLKASVKEDMVDGECDESEALWVDLHTVVHSSKLIIGVCYRPPNVNEEVETMERAARAGAVIKMGDFNYPEIDWINGTSGTVKGQKFKNLLQDNFMVQFIEAPTRNDALLDLIISNHAELITNVQIKEHLGSSDHNMISFDVSCK